MQSQNKPGVDRPRVAFRVGVSGAADFAPTDRVREQVATVLHQVREQVWGYAETKEAKSVYDPTQPPLLRLISPLADGADRLVAAEALQRDFQLDVSIPFRIEDYEATFGGGTPEQHAANVVAFRALLARAGSRVLVLDGDSQDETDRYRSYEAVGCLVVRNCDLLIAIWDDEQPSHGRGGTADTVHFALHAGVPVWWINATSNVPPRWLQDILDLPGLGSDQSPRSNAQDELCNYIAKAILPPAPSFQTFPGIWEQAIAGTRRLLRIQSDPLLAFLEETGKPNRKYWNLPPTLISSIRTYGARIYTVRQIRHTGLPALEQANKVKQQRDEPFEEKVDSGPGWLRRLARWLSEPFRRNAPSQSSSPGAALSRLYQQRYRFSYLLVAICAAVTLISVDVGLIFEQAERAATVVELVMLVVIVGLVQANKLLRWHERYLSYRMFGELVRLSRYLQILGWNMPGSRVNNLAHSTRRNWVAWFFAATERSVPLVGGGYSKTKLIQAKSSILESLIDRQLSFHEKRYRECSGAAHLLGIAGQALFVATIASALARLALEQADVDWLIRPLAFCSAVLPALSATLFGLRAYEEFEAVAEQSEQMFETLTRARSRIERIRVDRPLASQVLGAELFAITNLMLSDVEGWAQLFRMKPIEAG